MKDNASEFFFAEGFEIAPSEENASKLQEILETGESVNQVLEAGEFVKGSIKFSITREMLSQMLDNFRNRVIGTDPPVDFSHDRDGEASGWIKDLFLDDTGEKMFARIKWTESGIEKLRGLRFRYLSASFTTKFLDGSTGKQFGPTLSGAALTNIPFLRHMPAVVDLSQANEPIVLKQRKDEKMSDNNQISLADHNAAIKLVHDKLGEAEEKIRELSDGLGNVKEENAKLVKELSDKNQEIELKDRVSKFEKLLSDGKAVEAQREAFLSKDMDAFLNLSQPVNLKGKGHGTDPDSQEITFSSLPAEEREMFEKHLSGDMTEDEYLEAAYGKKPAATKNSNQGE